MAKDIGTNLSIIDKEDCFYIKVLKDAKQTTSVSGRSKLLALSGGFKSFEISGKKFVGKELGINIVISVRDVKKPKKRDDDED